ncbi:MAG TPA: GlsB/YeaQ/YmgE family stress response membrane protein [Caulobacteraceae bacterium]|nr:GlsB/YeaQ/YmgE family stress response membrane protein [Caulobacteraceae bacterium]
MSILAWLVVGLVAGVLAGKVIDKSGPGLVMDIVLGVAGAFVGGFLFTFFGYLAPAGIDLYNVLTSLIGAAIVLLVCHLLIRRNAI